MKAIWWIVNHAYTQYLHYSYYVTLKGEIIIEYKNESITERVITVFKKKKTMPRQDIGLWMNNMQTSVLDYV